MCTCHLILSVQQSKLMQWWLCTVKKKTPERTCYKICLIIVFWIMRMWLLCIMQKKQRMDAVLSFKSMSNRTWSRLCCEVFWLFPLLSLFYVPKRVHEWQLGHCDFSPNHSQIQQGQMTAVNLCPTLAEETWHLAASNQLIQQTLTRWRQRAKLQLDIML